MRSKYLRILAIIGVAFFPILNISAFAPLTGYVTDSVSGEPLSFVNVTLPKSHKGVLTNKKGYYSITPTVAADTLRIFSLGYRKVNIPISEIKGHKRDVMLVSEATQLQEVTVKPKKQKYSKKNNPAVELMERIRRQQHLTDPYKEPYYAFDKYEKISFALNNVDLEEDTVKKKKKGKFDFVTEYIDTASFTGKPILNLMVSEKASRLLHKSDPDADKEIVTGSRMSGMVENFDKDNMMKIWEDVFRNIDVYQNDITLMQNRFVSPLAAIGADYYKYYITDTVTDEKGRRLIELSFVPKTPESFGFNGKMYVAADDTTHFVNRIKMQVPKSINLNFVNNLMMDIFYEKDAKGKRNKVKDEMMVELQLLPGTPEIYVHRESSSKNFSYSRDNYYAQFYDLEGSRFQLLDAEKKDEDFWSHSVGTSLTFQESRMTELMGRLRGVKLFYWGEKAVRLLAHGYVKLGKPPYFDFGPLNTLISFDDVEGVRLRAGGYTTANLSPNLFLRGYGAYGTKDEKWKYKGELEWSFVKKKYHSREFPMHSLRLTHEYDLDYIGQHYLFTNQDNVFLSFKRCPNYKVTYRRLTDLEYLMERRSGFSLQLGVKHEIQEATLWLPFIDGYGNIWKNFTQAAFHATLRYAPGESFIQMQSMRLPVNMDAWVLTLSHEYGPKKMLGADFTLNKTEFSVQKRFWFSSFGYLDAFVKGGKIWSQVPYTSLTWPNANLSYTIQPESFALLTPMEFATDQYVTADLTYWMNGLLFNRIPLFNKSKLREVISFRAFYGSLTKKNDPLYNENLFRFPVDAAVSRLKDMPYMEIGFGIDNIFKILRLDYVWRLSYRDVPGVDKQGLRLALHFSF